MHGREERVHTRHIPGVWTLQQLGQCCSSTRFEQGGQVQQQYLSFSQPLSPLYLSPSSFFPSYLHGGVDTVGAAKALP